MASPFPPGVDFIPVPAPLLGDLLGEIDDLAELKVTLRAIWHIHQKKGVPRPVRLDELFADRAMAAALGVHGEALEQAVMHALDAAVGRGTFLRVDEPDRGPFFVLNTTPERRGIARSFPHAFVRPSPEASRPETWGTAPERPNVFVLYEENLGALTPVVAERLKEAQSSYPEEWIADAIEIAAESNVRNWKYVAAILERWSAEGRGNGKSRRDPEEARTEAYWQAYGKYVRGG